MRNQALFAVSAIVAVSSFLTSHASAQVKQAASQTLSILKQAGVGSEHEYARAGVLELGGFGNVTIADSFTSIGCSPVVGWFMFNGVELSLITGVNFISQEQISFNLDGGQIIEDVNSIQMLFLLEPSYHFKLTPVMWGFLGVGAGIANQDPGAGVGFAVAPRFGLNVMIGRSGIFTPAMTAIYQTTSGVQTPQGSADVSGTFGLTAGFTVMW